MLTTLSLLSTTISIEGLISSVTKALSGSLVGVSSLLQPTKATVEHIVIIATINAKNLNLFILTSVLPIFIFNNNVAPKLKNVNTIV